MRNTRTLIIALASGAALLTAACSKDGNERKDDPAATTEAPVAVESGTATAPSATAPSSAPSSAAAVDAPQTAAPAPKAPAK